MARRSRNKVVDFLDGFNAGFDTVGKVTEAFQLGDIANSEPTDFQQFTPEQATELEALAKTPGINIETTDSGYRVKNAETGDVRDIVPDATRSLFRNRFLDSPPGAAEQSAIRTSDAADVIARRNPIRAAQLRHAGMTNRQTEQDFADQTAIRAAFRQDNPPGLRRLDNPAQPGATEGMDASAAAGPPGTGLERIPMPAAATGDSPAEATAMPSMAAGTGAMDPASMPVPGGQTQPPQDFATGDRTQIQAAEAALQRGATRESADAYYRRKAPQIIDAYMKQGNVEGAKRYRDFIDSEEGRSYTHAWAHGVRQLMTGDDHGAVKTFEGMYNSQAYPDGNTVKLTPLEAGKSYQAQIISPDGKILNSVSKPTSEFVRQAGMALAPEKMAEFMAGQNAKRDSDVATLDRQIKLEQERQNGQETRDDRRDDRLRQQLDAQDRNLSRRLDAQANRGLTTTQQRTNDAIDSARVQLTGMSQPDVLRRTQSTTATGRTNPDYDPGLARAAKLATSRKFGDDPEHDAFSAGRAQPPAQGGAGIQQQFAADPSMRGMRLGKQTTRGAEVFDSRGKHVGYYNE